MTNAVDAWFTPFVE